MWGIGLDAHSLLVFMFAHLKDNRRIARQTAAALTIHSAADRWRAFCLFISLFNSSSTTAQGVGWYWTELNCCTHGFYSVSSMDLCRSTAPLAALTHRPRLTYWTTHQADERLPSDVGYTVECTMLPTEVLGMEYLILSEQKWMNIYSWYDITIVELFPLMIN